MDKFESLNHTKLDCKYYIVFIPKGWQERAVRAIEISPLAGCLRAGTAQGESDRREASDG